MSNLPSGVIERLSLVQSTVVVTERLRALRELQDDLDSLLLEAVAEAKERDYSWAAIAAPLRISKQHAHRHFAPRLARRRGSRTRARRA